jgi:hypothetical protein
MHCRGAELVGAHVAIGGWVGGLGISPFPATHVAQVASFADRCQFLLTESATDHARTAPILIRPTE